MNAPSTTPALVQVGCTALRAPDGSFLPAVPLYILVDGDQIDPRTGLTDGEEQSAADLGRILAGMKQLQRLQESAAS